MEAFIIGERRGEVRHAGSDIPPGLEVAVTGAHVTELIDSSHRGVRVLTSTALRPGRAVLIRRRPEAGQPEQRVPAVVVRCRVHRITRQGVLYEAALSLRET
jgi:hypothetical protein